MDSDFYKKLVDLYAGEDLPEDLEAEMERAALRDPQLSHDMFSLRTTVQALKDLQTTSFTEETSQRILLKMRTWGFPYGPRRGAAGGVFGHQHAHLFARACLHPPGSGWKRHRFHRLRCRDVGLGRCARGRPRRRSRLRSIAPHFRVRGRAPRR